MKNLIILSMLLFLYINAFAESVNHEHGVRNHTHPLPSNGITHKHGGGAIGSTKVTPSISNVISKINTISDQKGCLHRNSHPLPNEKMTWSGGCVNGYGEGTGTSKWYKNRVLWETFTGSKYKGKAQQGTFTGQNGVSFKGKFKDGNPHQGQLSLKGGVSFDGLFKNGKPYKGFLAYGDSSSFEGILKDSMPYHGTKVYAEGGFFEGSFKKGKPYQGVLTTNGRSIRVANGQIINQGNTPNYSNSRSNSNSYKPIPNISMPNTPNINSWASKPAYKPSTVYNASSCLGTVVNGRCIGTIRPSAQNNPLKKKCYGVMISGRCNGAIGY